MRHLLLRLRVHPSPLWVIFEVNFLRNLTAGLLTSILSIYFFQFVHSNAAVGMIFFTGYLAAAIGNRYSSYLILHLKKRKSLLLSLIGLTILFALFTVVRHSAALFILFALYQFMLSLFVLDIGLYIKHYSNFRMISENTGKLGAFGNLGWLVGPLLGSLIAEKFGFETVFFLSAGISLLALVIFFFVRLSNEEVEFIPAQPFAKNWRGFFSDANLRRTYFNNAGMGFIFAVWDFLPLLMLKIGATLPIIGLTKTLMGVPQSIFEFPIGRMADRETGERKIFIAGYFLAGLFTVLLGLTSNIKLFIIFFFIAATGTSFLEMTRDAYFFRQMPEQEVGLISVYRTSDVLPFLVGHGAAIAFLSVLPIELWFIIGGGLALFFALNACRLKELR